MGIKTKKKDALKFVSIIAGIIFVLLGVLKILALVLSAGLEAFGYSYYGYALGADYIMQIATRALPVILQVILFFAAALVLFINKNSSLIFIPVGLLTYIVFMPWVSTFASLILHRMYSPEDIANNSLKINLLLTVINLLLSLAIAAIPTFICFVASCTFLKKLRFIPMFLLLILFVVGVASNILLTGTSLLSIIRNYVVMLEYFKGMETVAIIMSSFVLPLLGLVNNALICITVFLTSVGMCTRAK